jgi:hypothetical protein
MLAIKNTWLPLLLMMCCLGCRHSGFDLVVHLNNNTIQHPQVTDGSVQLKFGHHEPLPAQPLDAKGTAQFKSIDPTWQQDSVSLIYLPSQPTRFRILDQDAYTAAGRNYLQFTLDFPADFTQFMWSLRDKDGNGIKGAIIHFDQKYSVETGSNGYFEVSLPKPAGEKAHFKIEKDGKVLMEKDIAIFPEYRRLILE